MIKVRNECIEPFYKNWKGLEKLSIENFCRAISIGQNDDMLYEVGLLCLKIHETFTSPMNKLAKLIENSKSIMDVCIFIYTLIC